MNRHPLNYMSLLACAALLLLFGAPHGQAAQDAGPGQSTSPSAVMLRLRTGAIHWGSILDHDADGFRFELLSNGGLVRVPWSLLDSRQQHELRQKFGYIDLTSEELMVDVERLLLVDGREVTGLVLSREGSDFVVKTGGNLQLVPKQRVRSISKGRQMPALDVYTREELYGMSLAETDLEDHEACIALARKCEKFLDFVHAVQHYEQALELAVAESLPEIEFALTNARVKAEQQVQIDYLREVDLLRKRQQFDEALSRLAAFGETFPESPLFSNAKAKETQVLKARDVVLNDLVRRRWSYWLTRLARQVAAEVDYQGAVEFAQEKLSEQIQERVLADVQEKISEEVTADQVLAFWASRKKVRFDNASYGLGTWLLGEDKARAGIESQEGAEETTSAKDRERQALEEKIKRFLKNQQSARRAKARADQEDEFQNFWAGFTLNGRANWIRAYYVEFAGDYEVRSHPYLKNCASCAGRGVHEIILSAGSSNTGSTVQLVPCPSCHGVGVVRRVYYR